MATVLAKTFVFKVGSVELVGLTAITISGQTWKTESTTSFASTGNPVNTYQPTIRDNGKFTLSLDRINDNTEQNTLRTRSMDGASENFVAILPGDSGETQTFSGYVTSWSPDVSVDGLNKVKCEVTVNGEVTLS